MRTSSAKFWKKAQKKVTVLAQVPGTYEPRGVKVVAARVHQTVGGSERIARLLTDRQGVHVCAQQHRNRPWAALAAAKDRDHGA